MVFNKSLYVPEKLITFSERSRGGPLEAIGTRVRKTRAASFYTSVPSGNNGRKGSAGPQPRRRHPQLTAVYYSSSGHSSPPLARCECERRIPYARGSMAVDRWNWRNNHGCYAGLTEMTNCSSNVHKRSQRRVTKRSQKKPTNNTALSLILHTQIL